MSILCLRSCWRKLYESGAAKFGGIYRWDGNAFSLVATHNVPPAYAEARRFSPFRPGPKHP